MELSDWRISAEACWLFFPDGEKVTVPESEPELAINRAEEACSAINNERFESGFLARFIHAKSVSMNDSAGSRP